MTKLEAIEYIRLHARPHGLESECLNCFFQDVKSSEKHNCGELDDYSKLAFDALYEWDI